MTHNKKQTKSRKQCVKKHVSNVWTEKKPFLTFPAYFLIPIIFYNLKSNCPNFLDLRNLQEQVKKAFCYQKLFWPFTVWINCSSDLKNFENSRPSASNFKSFSWSLEQFFLTAGHNNFGNKIPKPHVRHYWEKYKHKRMSTQHLLNQINFYRSRGAFRICTEVPDGKNQ